MIAARARDINCQWCPALVTTRSQIVETHCHGDPIRARQLFILLEAPGHDEDILGEPIMGPAGRKLKAALVECGIGDYYVGNAVRCWPGAGNRNPSALELDNCAHWLREDLIRIAPRVVLVLGLIAKASLSRVLGALPPGSYQLVEGLHPSAVLRRPQLHERFMESIEEAALAIAGLGRPASEPFAVEALPGMASVAADIETTGTRDKHMVAYTLADRRGGIMVCCSTGIPLELWRPWWPLSHTIMHDAKFDGPPLGIDLFDLDSWDDTMLLAYVIRYPELSLKTLEKKLLNMDSLTYTQLSAMAVAEARRKGLKPRNKKVQPFDFILEHIPVEAEYYAVGDSVGTYRLWEYLVDHSDERAMHRYTAIEKPLVPILAQMEADGVLVDQDRLTALGEELNHAIAMQREWIEARLPGFTSTLSPKLAQILLAHGVKLAQYTNTGRLAISEPALLHAVGCESSTQLQDRCENGSPTEQDYIVASVLDLRESETLLATFVDGLRRRLDSAGRVHCLWNQTVTVTGRLSSSDPNLQNQPARMVLGKEIRKAFRPNLGETWLRLDASQLELRIMADYTRDPTLFAAYPRGAPARDVHQMAADAMGIARGPAKNSMFEIAYGGGRERLARTAGIPLAQAAEFWEHIRHTMPGLVEWGHETRRLLELQGFLETRGGHRMYYPTYWSPNGDESADAFRSAVNGRIQGTAADIFKMLMVRGYRWIKAYDGTLLVQVHDELGISVKRDCAAPLAKHLQEVLDSIAADLGFAVPLELMASCGPSWGEQEELVW